MKIRMQAAAGIIVSASLLLVLGAGHIVAPFLSPRDVHAFNEGSVTEGGSTFPRITKKLRGENGRLVFGTSETGLTLGGKNYWALLQEDPPVGLGVPVVALGGAGRNAGIWAIFVTHFWPALQGSEVLFYLNPTYWQPYLNRYVEAYRDRYAKEALIDAIQENNPHNGLQRLLSIEQETAKKFSLVPAAVREVDGLFREMRSPLFFEFRSRFVSRFCFEKIVALWQDTWDCGGQKSAEPEFRSQDHVSGVTNAFLGDAREPLADVSIEGHARDGFLTFLSLAKRKGIKLTVFIGPYNNAYGKVSHPSVIEHYESLHQDLLNILRDKQTPYIDGWHLSYEENIFSDMVHLSQEGARRVASILRSAWK